LRSKKAHNAVTGNAGSNFQSGSLQVISHCGRGLLFRIGRLGDLVKLSADSDNLLLLLLDEFSYLDHVLTSEKKSVGIRLPTPELSHNWASSGNGMFH
jgi:hypothetical protein